MLPLQAAQERGWSLQENRGRRQCVEAIEVSQGTYGFSRHHTWGSLLSLLALLHKVWPLNQLPTYHFQVGDDPGYVW